MPRSRSSAALSIAVAFAAALGAHPSTAGAQAGPGACIVGTVVDRRTTPSSACTTCHDGKLGMGENGHRFDIPYDPSRSPGLRRDPEKFNPRVVLVDGKVACMSCHDPASTLLFHLAAPTKGTVAERLCVACHGFE